MNSKIKPRGETTLQSKNSTDYYNVNKTCEVFANVLLTLGTVENWFSIAFRRPRSSYAKPFDYAIINRNNLAVLALTELLKSPDNSIRSSATENNFKNYERRDI